MSASRKTNPFFAVRHQLGLSQEEMARKCGVTLTSWRNYETARSTPTQSKYVGICKGLGWSSQQMVDAVAWIELARMKADAA